MDIFSLLSYINKISLLAFFITIVVVGYQIYVLKKEKNKEKAPSIPDFKDIRKSNEVVNYTRLPDLLINKKPELVNYSKLIFLIISLLTIMVVIFVVALIKRNSSVSNQALVNSPTAISQAPTRKLVSPSPTCTGQACLTPTKALTVEPTITLSPSFTPVPSATPVAPSAPVSDLSLSPTEIVLAQAPSLTPTISVDNASSTQENNKPQVLPETGNVEKGLFIIGIAISAIFFSFWF